MRSLIECSRGGRGGTAQRSPEHKMLVTSKFIRRAGKLEARSLIQRCQQVYSTAACATPITALNTMAVAVRNVGRVAEASRKRRADWSRFGVLMPGYNILCYY